MLLVYDNVFTASALQYLHSTSSIGGLGDEHHTAFDRRAAQPRTPLESALHSVLLELGDESPCVEYWWRDEWQHVEAHCDVDEELFERDGVWSYPTNAHVLYLKVGRAVRGPTCVWDRADDASSAGRADFGALTTVPASEGRLLRFDGSLMHAVPEPVDVWLDEPASLELPTGSSEEDYVRSVVLFNTWPAAPLDVGVAPASDPRETVRSLAAEFGGAKIKEVLAAMEQPDDKCLPFYTWRPVGPRVRSGAAMAAGDADCYFVSLLGERDRRRQVDDEVELAAPVGLIEALSSEDDVTRFVAKDGSCVVSGVG